MALTETTECDKIEVLAPYKHVQIREATVIKKDDTELTGDIKISSTSGASTTVSAYMIKLHAS